MTKRQKEIIECLFGAWAKNEMPLYGGYSYGEVFEFMKSLGIDTTEAEQILDDFERMARNVTSS
jgi:hypothetical protein